MPNEYIVLKSTLHALDNRQFICGECKLKYGGSGYATNQQEKYQASKGCFKLSDRVLHTVKDIKYRTCIGNLFNYQATYLLEAFGKFELGTMPYPGSYLDQPNKIVDAFRIISSHKIDKLISDQQAEARSRKAGHGRSV